MALDFTYDPNFGKSSDSELDFTFDATAKPAKKQGIMAELGSSLKRGVGSTIDYGKLSLTDNPDEIAGIVSDNLRNQAPQSAARQKMNTDIQPYAQEASDAQGIMANIGAYGKLAGKRALQLAENPREFAGMVAENLPNSAPGLAGMVAGGVAGAATPIPFGAAIGGIVGGTAGGYKIEQGSSMFDQITKEAQARGIDTNDKASLSSMISEKYPEFLKASQLKGIGTAGTDAALNVATLGVAGMGERTLVKEARTVADLAKAGTITGEEAASALAGIEAKNAARNTIGQKVLRGTSVTAGEMAGESASEAVGQQMAYGKLDPLDVIDEGLLAFGQGVGMAAGRKFISPLVGATDKDTVAQEIERARSFAADLNASVGGDPNAVPTLVTDFGPIQQRIDELHGVDATQMDDKARAQYEKDFEAAYSEVVGYTTDANGLEIPFTAGDYLNSQVRSSDMTRDKPLAAGANDQSANRISQLADEESTQQPDVAPPTQAIAVTPAIPVIGPLSAVANAAVQSGAHQATVMQQAIAQQAQSSSTATGKTESATGNQQAAVAPNISPIAPSIGGVSNAAQPEQVAQKAPQANDAQAGTPATTAQGTGKSTGQEFIATRSDAQLTWLAEKGKGENKDLAKAELARRRGDIAEPQSTSVKEVRRTNHGDGYTGIEFSFGKDGFASVIAGPDGRAYVSNVQIGEADSTERGKGSGTKAYADIGAQLASQGIILESTRWDKHKSAISPAAIGVWEKLVAAGLAKKTGEIQGKIFDRFTSEETVGAVPTYEFVSQNQPEAAPVKSEQPQPAKGAENAQAQTEVLTKAGADTSNAAPAEPTAGQKKAENKAKLDAAIAKRKAENGAVTVDSGIKPKSTAQQSIVKRDLSGLAARDDLVGAIMRVTGNKGIAADMAQTITGDKAGSGNPKLRGLFLNGGTMDLGDVAELLRVQENFDVRDGDHLSELIRNAAAGDIATSMERTESDAVATEEAKRKDYYLKRASELGLKGVGGKRKLEHVVAQVDAKEAEIAKLEAKRNEMEVREERAAIQAENVYDEIAEQDMSESDWMDWLSSKFNYTQEEIDYVQAVRADRENDRAEANAGDDPQGEARGDTGQRQADVTTQAREGGTAEELTLTGQTNSQASAEFKRQQEEATKKDEATASPTVKGDQVDLFNTQDALFNSNRDVAPEAKQSAPIAQTNESVAVDTGNKIVFKDGETRPFSDIAQFLEQHVYGKEIGTKIPNPIFSVGKLSVKTVEDIAALIDGFGEKHANVRVSGYSLKHSDEQRHDKFAAVVADYPKAISGNPEILWNPTRDNSVFVVYPTGNNNLIVLEVAKNGNGTDIVNVITTKDRGMNQYRGKTAARLEGRLAPHPQVSEETPAGGDKFSAVQRAADSSVANQPTEDKPTEAKETDKGVALMEERAVYTVNEPDKLTDDLFQGTENAIPNTNRKTESSGRPAKRSEPVDRERASRVLAIREAADSPGVYNVSAQLVTVGERSLPVATINGSEDAARAFAYLSNYSVEHFDGLVTDADGNPLAVIGSFKGAQTQASVYPGTVMMELARIDGAANLWLSHNHPSGNANLSEADRRLSQAFSKILQGSSVSYRGMSAIARKGNDITWSNTDYDNGTIQANEPAPHRVPIVERMIVESIPGQAMSSPSVAKSVVPAIAKDVPGIVFLTAQNEVGSFVPFDPEEMGELRSGDRLMRLFRSAAKSGATGALVAIPDGKVSVAQFNNLAGALSSIEVNVLDGIRYDSESRIAGASVAETGEGSSVGDRFYNVIGKDKLTAADKAIYGMAAEGKSAADILKFIASASRNPFNRQLAKLLLKTGIAPSITVGDAKGWKFNAGEGNKYSAAYNPKTDMVALFRPAAAERNMLHELVHAATLKALEGKGLAAAQMNALYQHVKKVGRSQGLHYNKATGRGVYGMADIDEFIAEAFTNPKFQDALKKIAAPQASSTLSNAWQWFVRIVKGILGLPANQEDALSAALEIGVGVMREDKALRKSEAGVLFSEITGNEIDRVLGRTIQEKARNWMKARLQGKSFQNDATGWDISVGRKGIGKVMMHAAKDVHSRSVVAIPDLIKNAVLVASEANRNTKERDDVPMVHHFYAPLRVGGSEYVARLVVKETRSGQRFYDFDTSDEIGPAVLGETHTLSQTRGAAPSARLDMSMAELLSYVKAEHGGTDPKFIRYSAGPKQTDSAAFRKWFGDSKVVDADGKPLRVFHGTASDITAFDIGRSGESTGNTGFYGAGAYFSEDADYASGFSFWARRSDDQAPNVVPVYLSLKNPAYINITPRSQAASEKSRATAEKIISTMIARGTDQAVVDKLQGFVSENKFEPFMGTLYNALGGGTGTTALLKEAGFDGVTIYGGISGKEKLAEAVAFDPTQIKSAIGNNGDFDPSNPDIRYNITGDSGRSYDQSHRDFFKNVGRDMDTKGRIEKTLDYLKNDFWKKMAVGIVDQFRGLRDLNDGGQAYLLARLSKGTAGAFETLLHHGKLSIKDGVYDGDQSGGFIERLGVPLHGELDDFLWYVAANRAEGLAKHERENLFTPADIAAGKSLANGTTNFDYTIQTGPGKGSITRNRAMIFADANRVFNEFQKNTLDIAEQSGLIDGAARKFWESEFYVPFYRVSEEDGEFVGAKMGNSLVRQQAFKKLKGGADKLNSDLLSNTLLNWSHLIEASAKNRAAKASLVAAEQVGAAHKAAPGEKKTVWFMENGQKVEYGVDDPFVMTAITSLEYAGMRNGIMDVMTKFKHYLTIGVTASPAFKVRNLIRDSIQAIGTSDLGYSPIKNVTEGFQQTKRDSQQYVSALASGGLIRFGTMLEGSESSRVRQLIKSGVKDSSIIDSEPKWRQFYDKYLSAYNELGNRSEEINRAALYNQLIKQGKSHAEAALLARDLMDFSMQGSFNTIRFLTQVVPFMNARLQGLYKMGRSAKDNPKKLAVVTGAVAMASIALMLGYDDDDDWKRREDWDRDNYWWFKFGGEEWRIPKPFEVGAVGTLAERSIEYMFNDEMTGERFRKVIGSLVSNNLSMNPIPQVFKPVLDLYANKDSFTDRPIETMGMQRLDSTMRYNSNTSLVARGASSATLGILSPVQYDHLARAYFGWLGSFVVGGADMAARAVSDGPAKPSPDYWKVITQGIVREEGTGSSRYVTMIYDQAKELERAHASYRRLIADGKIDDAKEYAADHQDALRRYRQVEGVKRIEAKFNDRIHQVERSDIDPDEKKVRIERINKMKEGAAKRLAPGYGTNPIPE